MGPRFSFTLDVMDRTRPEPLNVTTYIVKTSRGRTLLQTLQAFQETNANFRFTYKKDPNYGPYLESVNGVAGNDKDHTYWELLIKTSDGRIIRPDAGMGCYIPSKNDQIILRFTTW